MNVFLARQPILDKKSDVFGYELLYREGNDTCNLSRDGDYASSCVLTSCFIDFGVEEITDNRKAFINFTEELLFNDIAGLFPTKYLVIEILEDVEITQEIVNRCRELKKKGYILAIDDIIWDRDYGDLINIVDIIKVDFLATSKDEQALIIRKYTRDGLIFLAEKVETETDYRFALDLGYSLFQGYYFAKPEVGSRKKIVPFKESHIKLIRYLNSNNKDFNKLSKIIEHDVSFSYEILHLVNSAHFGIKNKITSIKHAVVTLGFNELKKWLYLAIIRDIRQDKPSELVNICMLRAKFMENIAVRTEKQHLASEMMTIGMFSMIDILTNKDMKEILDEMNFSDNIKSILLKETTKGFMAESLNIVINYEKGKWDSIEEYASNINISISELNKSYLDAVKWLNKIKF